MNAPQAALVALAVSAGLVAGAALAWSLSKRWYGRRLRAARTAQERSDESALAAQEHMARARRHIAALTEELVTQKKAVSETELLLQRAREAEELLQRDVEEAKLRTVHSRGPDTGHGFADTQIMS